MTSLMFALSAAFWVDSIVHVALVITNDVARLVGANAGDITIFNALILINVSFLLNFDEVQP
jgi:hypothetical protein